MQKNKWQRLYTPYPFEGAHLRISFRKHPIHTLGSGMQITGTRIIAQSLPILHHFVFIRLGQSGDIGKTFHKADEIIVPLHHTRLLKNDFRYPYYIRICRIPPGKFTFIFLVPILYCIAEIPVHAFWTDSTFC